MPIDRNQASPVTPARLRTVCIALIAGQLLFLAVAAYLRLDGGFTTDGEPLDVLRWIGAGLALVMVPVGFVLRGMRFRTTAELDGTARANAYAGATILFFALLEAPALLNIMVFLLTGAALPALAIVFVILAVQIASMPSDTQFENLGR